MSLRDTGWGNRWYPLIEHVPARVNEETGERSFAPETVERLQQIVWSGHSPNRTIETLVFEK